MAPDLTYIRDPAAIYAKSFETIRAEADLLRFPKGMDALAIRLIHACGMVDLTGDIAFSDGAFEAGREALAQERRSSWMRKWWRMGSFGACCRRPMR